MLKISDGKIGTKEFMALVFLSMGTQGADTTPDLLVFAGKNAAWIIPILSFLILLIPFLVLLTLIKKHNQGLMELLDRLGGKVFSSLIGLLLFIIIFSATVVNSRSYVDIVNTMFYPKTPIIYLFFVLMLTSFLIAKRGLETIGRTSWTLLWWFNLFGLLLFIFVWKFTNWRFLFPLAGPGMKHLVIESVKNVSIYGDVILLAAFYPFLRSFRSFRTSSLIGWGLASFWMVVIIALSISVFDYPAIEYLKYMYHQLTRVARIGTFAHLESVFLGVWIVASVIHFSIYIYITAFFFARMLRLNEFERFILPLAGLSLLIGLLPDNIVQLNEVKKIIYSVSSSTLLALPFVLWLLDRWKGWRRT